MTFATKANAANDFVLAPGTVMHKSYFGDLFSTTVQTQISDEVPQADFTAGKENKMKAFRTINNTTLPCRGVVGGVTEDPPEDRPCSITDG